MTFKKILLVSVIVLNIWPLMAQRKNKTINNDWQFTYSYLMNKQVSERVDVPHTWNAVDALTGKIDYYRGGGKYVKEIFIEEAWKNKRLFLKFEGVNSVANVFINEKHIGEHRGGYTSFVFELTDRVKYGEMNTIMVRASNALQLDVMPLLGDFNFYGGIYRDVHLMITDKANISPLDYASSGVYLTQKNISKKKAEIEAVIKISNPDKVDGLKLNLKVVNGTATTLTKTVDVAPEKNEVVLPFTISNPHLWNGVKDPFMYQVKITLTDGKGLKDQVVQPLGLRFFKVDANEGFFLNGEHIQLRGVCRHQDRAVFGNALRKEHHNQDLAMIQEMGANSIRLSHYPHAPYFYDLIDKAGLVAWSEIPFVGPGGYGNKGFVDQESFKENGKQQLIEMIRQNYNHPSVCFWGLFNELKTNGDNPSNYVRELNECAHKEDPSRITTSATNIGDRELTDITDLLAWNRYFGWYRGMPKDIAAWADDMHEKYPEDKLGLSEYGAGASAYHHENGLQKPKATSRWHPEKWQAHFHEEQWKAIDVRPFIWGTYIWNMFDFGATHRAEGEVDGKNDKGLISMDRQVKKDAFYFYKANWNTSDKFVHINEKRYVIREEAKTLIKVYSNCENVQLFVNGISKGKIKGEYGIFVWNNIELLEGDNKIFVVSKNKKEIYSDFCTWTLQ